ncbi:MAG: DUF4214 domain-containing protein [Pseudomonadota bacterium]
MAGSLYDFALQTGSDAPETLAAADREILAGNGGADSLANAAAGATTYLLGGSGNDAYSAAGDAITIIHETGGDPNDSYADIFRPLAGESVIAEVEGRHLLVASPEDGGALLFVDWRDPAARIESFALAIDTPEGVVVETLDFAAYEATVTTAPVFQGTIGFAEAEALLGGVTDLEATIAAVIAGEPLVFGQGLTEPEAETVALLYEAAFGREADSAGLNFWIDAREDGLSEDDLAALFLASDEFAALFGPPESLGDEAYVETLYRNILGRDGEEAGIAFWTDALGDGLSRETVLLDFAESVENRANNPEVETLAEITPGDWEFA